MKLRSDAAIFLCIFLGLPGFFPRAEGAVYYVDVNCTNSVAPFTSWSTAAQTIQEAVAVAAAGDLVLVNNGYYQVGGITNFPEYSDLTNRVAITNAMTVQSVNGPAHTFIVGGGSLGVGAIRGVFMAPGAVLSGFTVSNGNTMTSGDYYDQQSGGGVWCSDESCIVTNCIVVDNNAWKDAAGVFRGTLYNCALIRNYSAGKGGGVSEGSLQACDVSENFSFQGGGVYYSVLRNCVVANNFAYRGGGAEGGELDHCTIVTNWAMQSAGGVYDGQMINCILYYNDCTNNPNWEAGTIRYTCTDPLPLGEGNIAETPVFVSIAAGDYRLTVGSAGIDAAVNGLEFVDKDNVPRPLDGNLDGTNTADMGAYEFVHGAGDSDQDGILDGYEIDYRLNPLDPADAALDSDGDGPVNSSEFIAGTNPNDSNSFLRLTGVQRSSTNQVVTWSSATGRVYVLERMVSMTGNTWSVAASGLAARPPKNVYTDVVSQAESYYRVWVCRTNAYYPP